MNACAGLPSDSRKRTANFSDHTFLWNIKLPFPNLTRKTNYINYLSLYIININSYCETKSPTLWLFTMNEYKIHNVIHSVLRHIYTREFSSVQRASRHYAKHFTNITTLREYLFATRFSQMFCKKHCTCFRCCHAADIGEGSSSLGANYKRISC